MAKTHYIELGLSEAIQLNAFIEHKAYNKRWREHRRAKAIYLSYRCLSVKQITQDLRCSTHSVYAWFKRYEKYGLDGLRTKPVPYKLLTHEQINRIIEISGWKNVLKDGKPLRSKLGTKACNKTWSFRKISQWIKDNWHITISHERIRQIIYKELKKNAY